MIAAPSRPVFMLALRTALGGRRVFALLSLNLIPVIAAVAGAAGEASHAALYARVVGNIVIPIQVALVALALAGATISDERDESTILYLTQTPLARMAIVGAKLAAIGVGTAALTLPGAIAGALLVSGRGGGAVLITLAAVWLATLAYAGLFTWLAFRLRRAVVSGLLYIVIWEGSIASFAASADRLSVSAYARRIAKAAEPDFAWRTAAPTGVTAAVIALLVFTLGGLWLGTRRLERMELP